MFRKVRRKSPDDLSSVSKKIRSSRNLLRGNGLM